MRRGDLGAKRPMEREFSPPGSATPPEGREEYGEMAYTISMKGKATFCLSLMPDGDVIGRIIDEQGSVVESKNFGKFSVEEFEKCSAALSRAMPELHLQPIDITITNN